MLRTVHSIEGYAIHAEDGEIGSIKTVYFDDRTWKLKYFVVKLGSFWNAKEVLILPMQDHKLSWQGKFIEIGLTKDQVKNSKPYEADLPVSVQHEIIDAKNFEALYLANPWSGAFLPMWFPDIRHTDKLIEKIGDEHLRSCGITDDFSVVNSKLEKIGAIKDFIFDVDEWQIKYLIIDTNGFLPYGDVMVSTQHVKSFNTDLKELSLDLNKEELEDCPAYNHREPINKEEIINYYDYEGKLVKTIISGE